MWVRSHYEDARTEEIFCELHGSSYFNTEKRGVAHLHIIIFQLTVLCGLLQAEFGMCICWGIFSRHYQVLLHEPLTNTLGSQG